MNWPFPPKSKFAFKPSKGLPLACKMAKDFSDNRDHVSSLVSNDQAITIGMIKAEILQGTKTQKEYEDLERRLGAIRYCPFDEALWEEVFRTAFQMRRKGFSTPVTDVVIAVSALMEEATVVHADKHFDELSKVTGLKVKSYVSELRK